MLSEIDSHLPSDDEDTTDYHGNLIIKYKITLEIKEKNHDIEKLANLLTKLKDIDSADANDNNNTLLHFAVKVDNDRAVELLLKNGASINKVNKKGQTPLQVAELLSPKNSDAKKNIQTLLTQSQEGQDSMTMEASISDNGTTETQPVQIGKNIFEPTSEHNSDRAKYLLSKHDIENSNSDDIMRKINELFGHEMFFASNIKKQQILQNIVNEACDEDGNTALILCAKRKDSEKVKLFLDFEADVNKTNNENLRAADYAWLSRDYNSLLELYNKGSCFPKGCSEKLVESEHKYSEDLKKLISQWKKHEQTKLGKLINSSTKNQYDKENVQKGKCIDAINELHKQFQGASKEERLFLLRKVINEDKKKEMKPIPGPCSRKSSDIGSYSKKGNLWNKDWDEDGNTPLILAAKERDHEMLMYLLNNGAEPAKQNIYGDIAIEYSWESKDYLSVLELLKRDSYFPSDAETKNIDKEKAHGKSLSEFIVRRNKLHEAIKEGKVNEVECIALKTENQKSELFLSPSNKSALFYAAESGKIDVHAFLLSKGAAVRESEKEKYQSYRSGENEEKLKVELNKYIFEPEVSLVKKLLCKSTYFGKFAESDETILNFYRELESCEHILPILKVLQFHPYLQILFGLSCRNTKNKDPDDPDGTRGSTDFINGKIHIAAKDSNYDGEQRYEVLGTLAHEMAHQAFYLIYNNQCNPYLKEDSEELEEITMEICQSVFWSILKEIVEEEQKKYCTLPKNRFLERVKNVLAKQVLRKIKCEKNEKFKDVIADINMNFINDLPKVEEMDSIIKLVYNNYEEEYWDRELIVRIPHMIAKYGESIGKVKLMKQVPKLMEYYEKKVIPRMEEFLRIGSNSTSNNEALEIFNMNEYLGIMKSIDKGEIRLKNPSEVEPHYLSSRGFEMVKTSSIHLCTIYFYQILKNKYNNFFHMQCLFINMSSFKHNIEKILHLAKSEVCKAIVLISDSSSCDIKTYVKSFAGSKSKIYVILNYKYPENCKPIIFKWSHFTDKSKEALVKKIVAFCGTTVTPTQLLNSNKLEYLDFKALAILVEEKFFEIDGENESHLPKYDNENYIERYFCKQVIKKDILSKVSKEYILYLTNVPTEELFSINVMENEIEEWIDENNKLERRILIRSSRTKKDDEFVFHKIKEKCNIKQMKVHWMNMENGYLIWKESSDQIEVLEKFVDADKKIRYDGEIIDEVSKKVVILTDQPGMGKSTILSKLQDKFKAKKLWTLRFHVKDLVKKFLEDNYQEEMSLEKAINIIADIKFSNPLKKSIFKICCYIEEQIVLIFDGFDEMQIKFRYQIINLIKSLISSKIKQIWISARTNLKTFLERELQVMAFSLNDWNEQHQIEFANKLWNKELNSLDKDKYAKKCCKLREAVQLWREGTNLKSYQSNNTSQTDGFPEDISNIGINCNSIDFSKYLEYIISQLNEELKKFVSIPLHTRILANVIFEENFRIENGLNIYKLYKHFIQQMFQGYYDKCQLDFKNCLFLQELLNEKLLATSQCIVRDNLGLDKNSLPQEINEKSNIDNILDCFNRIGLCTTSGQFFHQNIAEYLFVEWIFVNSGMPDIKKFCVDRVLIEENLSVVRQFVNSKIELMKPNYTSYENKHFLFNLDTEIVPKKLLSIFKKIIAEGLDSIFKFFLENFPHATEKTMNTKNKKMQNILHHVCNHGQKNILNEIFEFITKYPISSSFFNQEDESNTTPFEYAIKTDNEELVESFITNLEHIYDSCWANEKLILLDNNSSDSALHTAIYARSHKVLKFLWNKIKVYEKNGNKFLESILKKQHQRSKNTVTHIAAHNGCSWLISEIFEVLVKRNSVPSENLNYLNIKNYNGYTFLHVAVLRDDVVFLDKIISIQDGNKNNTNVKKSWWRDLLNKHDNWEDTALHKSAYRSHTETLKCLLNFSNQVLDEKSIKEFHFLQNKKKYTALHKSAFHSTFVYFEEYWEQLKSFLGDMEFLKLVKVCNRYGNTILHTAASVGNLEIVKKLCNFLNEKDETNFLLKTDSDEDTALHKACIKGHIKVLLHIADFVETKMKKDFIKFFCEVNKHSNNVLDLAVKRYSNIHHDILEYANKKLTEEKFKEFCKNLVYEPCLYKVCLPLALMYRRKTFKMIQILL